MVAERRGLCYNTADKLTKLLRPKGSYYGRKRRRAGFRERKNQSFDVEILHSLHFIPADQLALQYRRSNFHRQQQIKRARQRCNGGSFPRLHHRAGVCMVSW